MTLLVHASACDNQACPSTNCNKVKALFKHAVACQQKVQGGCHLCRSPPAPLLYSLYLCVHLIAMRVTHMMLINSVSQWHFTLESCILHTAFNSLHMHSTSFAVGDICSAVQMPPCFPYMLIPAIPYMLIPATPYMLIPATPYMLIPATPYMLIPATPCQGHTHLQSLISCLDPKG